MATKWFKCKFRYMMMLHLIVKNCIVRIKKIQNIVNLGILFIHSYMLMHNPNNWLLTCTVVGTVASRFRVKKHEAQWLHAAKKIQG